MPHVTKWETNGVYWSFSGVVTQQEQEEADGEMYGDPRFDTLKYYIWDGTNISKLVYKENEAEQFAAIDKVSSTYRPNLKGALIAKDDDVRNIIKRYIQSSKKMESTWDLAIFESIEDARQWLSV